MSIRISLLTALDDRRALPIIFCLFAFSRLALVFLAPTAVPTSDSAWYVNRATTLLEQGTYSEGGYRTAYWPVGYPAFLWFLFAATGPSLLAAKLANLAMASLSFWLLYFFVMRSFHDELTARITVLLLTLYPNNAAYVPLLLTETLYLFLLLGASAGLFLRRRWQRIFVAGILFGLATLVKTQTILLIPVAVIVAFMNEWSWTNLWHAVLRGSLVGIVAALVVCPWTIRNYLVFDALVPVSTNGGVSLLAGNNPSVVGDYRHDYSDTDELFASVPRNVADQLHSDRRARDVAIEWIKTHPWLFISLIPKKVFRLWAPDGEAEWGYQDTPFYRAHATWFRAVRIANQAFYVAIMGLFLAAFVTLFRARANAQSYYGIAVIATTTVVSIIFSGQSRYHFSAMPFVFAYVASFIVGRSAAHSSRQGRDARRPFQERNSGAPDRNYSPDDGSSRVR